MTDQLARGVTLAVFLVFAFFVLGAWAASLVIGRRRRAATKARWLDEQADRLGIQRLPGETDAELRARLARFLRTPQRATAGELKHAVVEALWTLGYPRAEVRVQTEPGFVRVNVDVPEVDDSTLEDLRRAVLPCLPLGVCCVFSSGPAAARH